MTVGAVVSGAALTAVGGGAGVGCFGFGVGSGFGFGAGFEAGFLVVVPGSVAGGETAAVVGFVFTFALAAGLGFDTFFLAGFDLAAAVAVAFGTIGTTVSTASVAAIGASVVAGGAVETEAYTARSGARASFHAERRPRGGEQEPHGTAEHDQRRAPDGEPPAPPVCQYRAVSSRSWTAARASSAPIGSTITR